MTTYWLVGINKHDNPSEQQPTSKQNVPNESCMPMLDTKQSDNNSSDVNISTESDKLNLKPNCDSVIITNSLQICI